VNGTYIIADLARMPHLLIAGSTGSGKSVCINGIISTFLLNRRPEDLQMVLIDPKMVELTGFNGVPHLKCPVVTEMGKVVGTLRLVLKEMEDRYQRFSMLGVRNIDGYNLRRDEDSSLEKLPYLVVIIDELADLMLTTPEEVETLLVRLAQMARATGIHLLIATQRPSVDVLTGLIKANVPARIAFAVTSHTDSRVILDLPGAERLLGRGDMLFLPPDEAKPMRVQGSFIDDKDIQFLVRHWRRAAPNHAFDQEWAEIPSSDGDEEGGDDPLMEQALRIVRQHGSASASMLQRRLRIGYNRAARLIEQMEDEGIVGPADGSRGRAVYLSDDEE
jgi:S-DNA-T family DNA segregation ATPase FtsK/SpoIIIE